MITVKDIALVRYQVADLGKIEDFLRDVGVQLAMRTTRAPCMRAGGPAHHVHVSELGPKNKAIGYGLLVDSEADLERLADRLGLKVVDNPEPGDGKRVRIPHTSDFPADAIHGQAAHQPINTRAPVMTREHLNKIAP